MVPFLPLFLLHNLWDLKYLLRQLFWGISCDLLNFPAQLQTYELCLPHVQVPALLLTPALEQNQWDLHLSKWEDFYKSFTRAAGGVFHQTLAHIYFCWPAMHFFFLRKEQTGTCVILNDWWIHCCIGEAQCHFTK